MPSLPSLGALIKYGQDGVGPGSFTFPVESKSKLSFEPVYDRARRAVKFTRYTLMVDSFIMAPPINPANPKIDGTTNAQLDTIRKVLTTPGLRLEYSGLGFGATGLLVNDPAGPPNDVKFGPHPEIVQAETMGFTGCWTIQWKCITEIKEGCASQNIPKGNLLAYTLTWSVTVDEHGFSTRQIEVEAEIPNYRDGTNKIKDVADLTYWEKIVASVPIPRGFQRNHSHKVSEDQSILSGTITDVELAPEAFLPAITEWEGEHSVQSSFATGNLKGVVTIAATFHVARGKPKQLAWDRFGALVTSIRKQGQTAQSLDKTGGNKDGLALFSRLIPIGAQVNNGLGRRGMEISFRASYFFIVHNPIDMLVAAGMWTPVPDAIWESWKASMGNAAVAPRGNANLALNVDGITIIDACGGNPGTDQEPGVDDQQKQKTPAAVDAFSDSRPPDPQKSYLMYDAWIVTRSRGHLARHKPLSGSLGGGQISKRPAASDIFDKRGSSSSFAQGSVPPDTIQQRSTPHSTVVLFGRALRAGYPVAKPALVSIGGVTPVLADEYFAQRVAANYGIPVHIAQWRMEYWLPAMPTGTVPVPFDPTLMPPPSTSPGTGLA